MHDTIVRPHGGDVLAAILVYLGLRAITRLSVDKAAALAFALACVIETGQALDLLHRSGLDRHGIAATVLGAHFDWGDILAYAVGILIVLLVERRRR